MENIVFLDLKRRGYAVSVGRVGDKEIDFIGKRGGECIYIQVCYLLAGEETIKREFGVFYRIADNFAKYVVSMDELNLSRDGIHHKNIREFLLAESF